MKIIRESWASLVEAGENLFINPKNYEFGDRIRAAAKILAVGASVVIGTVVREAVAKTPFGQLAEVGPCGADLLCVDGVGHHELYAAAVS